MPTDTLTMLAHTSNGGWAPDGDDRHLVDRELGLVWVANGSGPTYGGYHAPFALDPGLEALRDAFARSRASEPARLLDAVAAADAVMKRLDAEYRQVFATECSRSRDDRMGAALRAADALRPAHWRHGSCFCHFGGSVTACSILEDALCFAQVGDGRAYLMREGNLQVLVNDHTLPTMIAAAGGTQGGIAHSDALTYHRDVVTKLLGLFDRLVPNHAQVQLAPRDIVLLCTAGVWNQDKGEELVRRLLTASPDGFRDCLDATARSRGRDATAVRLTAAGG